MDTLASLLSLHGRTALVTGGSRGLGLEIAEGLAEAGARVWITARREAWLGPALDHLRAAGYEAEARVCDVAGRGRDRFRARVLSPSNGW